MVMVINFKIQHEHHLGPMIKPQYMNINEICNELVIKYDP